MTITALSEASMKISVLKVSLIPFYTSVIALLNQSFNDAIISLRLI